MAITDINEYAHLTDADVEALGAELDALRREIEADRGERDVRYLRRTILAQRALEVAGRLALFGSHRRSLWLLGTGSLALAKIIENMELGHNVMHGQWDWMNDPEVHSTTWEWDMVCASPHWKHSHNYIHHKYTNVIGMDHDVGYKTLRVTRDEPWQAKRAIQPVTNLLLAAGFEWGIGLHDLEIADVIAGKKSKEVAIPQIKEFLRKIGKQVGKDYVLFPALTGPNFVHTLTANVTANVIRNVWAYVVIFCGHFPDGAEKFTADTLDDETPGQWYLRQMLGSANFNAGPAMAFMSGNLCYQIEHHLYPDLPSNRLADISVRVRELCDKYDLPYTTGSLWVQYLKTLRTINKLALPDRFLRDTADDAPETASERRFAGLDKAMGLKTAIGEVRRRRRLRRRAGRA
ncbi:fatty acid desaturase [Gordonia sp. 852002-50816_SCH5313054-c]|uniref:Fatty acid desaturase n=1 Tax=Gordonia jacobaea TaxID=122202 RepID=A0ABR5IDZ8_9ACTN|nr:MULTISPECIES: fatty acid desaturase [Gordonia]KNA91601.1 fatty acid desaturase [Gordonia jacobaea]OBC03994.1 fatty acid desaturase [Gordonia sp. 852002-50816_SCH5313054-a]OBC14431.1 fatty acid desaturase [Gordonia sp. 852002-50816_SCH5313054-c]